MDFSSLNPNTSNALSLAARRNDVQTVERLLNKLNPNCVDNRGWTALHEAAAHDSYESLVLLLKHRRCRPLAETHEGHTALYLACRHKSSIKTIIALLNSAKDIANYGSTESVTPLHVASSQGRIEVIQLLIEYGAILNVQDFDGDTPLHDSALAKQHQAVTVLLYAGADPSIKSETYFTPFHLACYKGCFETVKAIFPFVVDINQQTLDGDTPLILGIHGYNDDIMHFLLKNGADPHIKNECNEMALNLALNLGYSSIFKILLEATDIDKINRDIVQCACKPHYFKLEILEALLNHELGPEFFGFIELFHITLEDIGEFSPAYLTNSPLNSYLNIGEYIYNQSPHKFREFFELFLMRGVGVDALDVNECPPLVYIHYCGHRRCFGEVFTILREYGCNVDYCTAVTCHKDRCIPDAFIASLTSNPATSPVMLQYSLYCEPGYFLQFAYKNDLLERIQPSVQNEIISMIDSNLLCEGATVETLCYYVPCLRHLSRLRVREILKHTSHSRKTTNEFLNDLKHLHLPSLVTNYLRYL